MVMSFESISLSMVSNNSSSICLIVFSSISGGIIVSKIFDSHRFPDIFCWISSSSICVPFIDCIEVEVTKYFCTRGSKRNGAEDSVTPALRSTSTMSASNAAPIMDRNSEIIYLLF